MKQINSPLARRNARMSLLGLMILTVSAFGFTLLNPSSAYASNSDIKVTIDGQGDTWTKKGDVISIFYTFRNNSDHEIKITKYTSSLHLTSSSKDSCGYDSSGNPKPLGSIVGKKIGVGTPSNPNGALLGCTVHYTITAADVKAQVVKETVTLGWSGGTASGSTKIPLTGVSLCDDGTPAGASGCTADQQDPSKHNGGLITYCADGTKLGGTTDCSAHGGAYQSGTEEPLGANYCGSPDLKAINTNIDLGCKGQGEPIMDLLFALIRFVSYGVGLVIVGSLTFAGIQYIGSRGDPSANAMAIKRITANVTALLLFAFAYAIINYIVPGQVLK
jgi:hypothetical protein